MNVQCLVVGEGPAGLSAAAEAARWGAETILVEEHSPRDQSATLYGARGRDLGNNGQNLTALSGEVRAAGATVLREAVAWAAFEDGAFGIVTPSQSLKVFPESVVLATGAYERLLPFAGWHLTNVMTPSEALAFSRGRRGGGSFRWVVVGVAGQGIDVAAALRASNADVVAVAEAEEDFQGKVPEAKGPEVKWGYIVNKVTGSDGVRGVELTSMKGDGPSLSFDADGVCIAWGSTPMGDLAQVAGCEVELVLERGGYVPTHDGSLATSVEGIFVAGDVAGLCGVKTATAQGRLAGLMAAHQLGKVNGSSFDERRDQLASEVQKFQKSDSLWIREETEAIQRLEEYYVRLALEREDVLLCRCPQNQVSGAAIAKAITKGGAEVPVDLKRFTQAGMGECQGRMCRPLLSRAISLLGKRKDATQAPMRLSYRPPVRPVPLTSLLADDE